jgi:predicted metalloprotease
MRATAKSAAILLTSTLLAACSGGGEDDGASAAPPNPAPTSRDSYPAAVFPVAPSPFVCLPPGIATQAVMQKLNAFWQSGVVACGCDATQLAMGCRQNAFVSGNAYGYIFYDANFLNQVDAQSGSPLPADFLMAHEFGHNIQLALNLNRPGKLKELQADCLGGYYVGHQSRIGAVNQSELVRTFQFACAIGDPFVSNWWDQTHGTCAERVAALQQGIAGNVAGGLPGQACP